MNYPILFLSWGIVGLVTWLCYVLLSIKIFPYKRDVSVLEQIITTLIGGPIMWVVILFFWVIMLVGVIENYFTTKKK